MKFNFNGLEVEIKVKEGTKKADFYKAAAVEDDITMALIHASAFLTGQGMYKEADHYSNMAAAMMNNRV